MSALQKHKSTKGFFKEILRIFLNNHSLKHLREPYFEILVG